MSNTLTTLHQNIQRWYLNNGRHDLPWRNTRDPYRIYLSEVMLQQTQVKTVLERYYFPFLQRFQTLKSLGEAPLDEVLKLWEGLGYYTRARNMHHTAQLTDGTLPSTIDALIKLPGIGINTAHAIAVFAFGQAVPVMEANVKRILCRMELLENPSHKELWKTAYNFVDQKNAYDYNQAMMDIGSMICLPANPLCRSCPLAEVCKGKAEPERYPLKKKRIVPTRENDIVLYSHNGQIALRQREEKFLHGLWGFFIAEAIPDSAVYLGAVMQQYTHFKHKCQVYCYHETIPKQKHYFSTEKIDTLAISKIDEKIIKLLLQSKNKNS